MKKIIYSGIAVLSLLSVFSCKNEKQDKNEDIIIERVIEKPQNSAIASPDKKSSGTIKWVNSDSYRYSINISANDSLAEVRVGEDIYKDNSVHLTITRSDGSVFFNSNFTKSSFTGLLSKEMKEHGVLVGFSFDHADETKLYFVASIGSPDESSEEFTLVMLIVDKMGSTTVATYTPDEVPRE